MFFATAKRASRAACDRWMWDEMFEMTNKLTRMEGSVQ
jgi:hypothetical protein